VKRHRSNKEQKKLADDARLLRAWKAWHREEREAVVAGPHGPVLAELFRMLENLQHVQPPQLIGLVRSINWAAIDYATRLVVLHELDGAITKYREQRGAEPIDDNLFDQPDPPFRVIRRIIHQVPHVENVAPTEAQLGQASTPQRNKDFVS
jgi:hypothetical protein